MANHRALNEEQDQKALGFYPEGYSGTVIAKLLGVKAPTVYAALRRLGVDEISRNNKRTYVSAEQLQQLVDLYKKGHSCEELSFITGVPWSVVNGRLVEAGVAMRPAGFQRGEAHHCWKGGRIVLPAGYVMVRIYPDDPFFCMSTKKMEGTSYVLEHRYVMAKKLGRPLRDEETVHHKDGDKQNNAEDNLQLRLGRHGSGAAFRCACCGSFDIEALDS